MVEGFVGERIDAGEVSLRVRHAGRGDPPPRAASGHGVKAPAVTATNAASFGVVDEERDLDAIVQVELGQQA